jgi:hypothetical protein
MDRWQGQFTSALTHYSGGSQESGRSQLRLLAVRLTRSSQDISHDEAVGVAYLKDPMVKQVGSLRGISDMLDGVNNQSVFIYDISPLVLRANTSYVLITLVGPQTFL